MRHNETPWVPHLDNNLVLSGILLRCPNRNIFTLYSEAYMFNVINICSLLLVLVMSYIFVILMDSHASAG